MVNFGHYFLFIYFYVADGTWYEHSQNHRRNGIVEVLSEFCFFLTINCVFRYCTQKIKFKQLLQFRVIIIFRANKVHFTAKRNCYNMLTLHFELKKWWFLSDHITALFSQVNIIFTTQATVEINYLAKIVTQLTSVPTRPHLEMTDLVTNRSSIQAASHPRQQIAGKRNCWRHLVKEC